MDNDKRDQHEEGDVGSGGPSGEALLGSGYGADAQIVSFVPPPDDHGVGMPLPVDQADAPQNDGGSGDGLAGSESDSSTAGSIGIDSVITGAFFGLLLIAVFRWRTQPEVLVWVLGTALVAVSAGFFLSPSTSHQK